MGYMRSCLTAAAAAVAAAAATATQSMVTLKGVLFVVLVCVHILRTLYSYAYDYFSSAINIEFK